MPAASGGPWATACKRQRVDGIGKKRMMSSTITLRVGAGHRMVSPAGYGRVVHV